MGDRVQEVRAYENIANAYYSLIIHLLFTSLIGNAYYSLIIHKKAKAYYKKDLSIAKEVGDRAREGHVNGNLGKACRSLNDFQQAIEHYKNQLNIAKEAGDRA